MTSPAPAPGFLGSTLVIANPAAKAGASRHVAEQLKRFLSRRHHLVDSFELIYTEHSGHATEIARCAQGFSTVLALGGDGVVHEAANGLMDIDAASRPALGVIPVGSGNDFARTLGLQDFSGERFAQYLACERIPFDVGRIQFEPGTRTPHEATLSDAADSSADRSETLRAAHVETEYVIQSFSFGLDAAIALGTFDLRRMLPLSGAPLYFASGLEVLARRFRTFPITACIDDEGPLRTEVFFMAVQLGPTYGSGFRICPEADPTDGFLDLCYASGRTTRIGALSVLLRAKGGNHLGSRLISMRRAKRIELAFEDDTYPIQADGERIVAHRVEIEILPGALTVLKPIGSK